VKKSFIVFLGFANPAFASSNHFFSFGNTDLIVTIAFLSFIAVLFYLDVPKMVTGMLDTRADGILSELNQARTLREEAQGVLACYERKQKEVAKDSDQIIARAKEESKIEMIQAKKRNGGIYKTQNSNRRRANF
jgi:F-type H+-transporting ATPase subunit b